MHLVVFDVSCLLLYCLGLMSPTLAPTVVPALAPLAPASAPMQNDLLESGFDALGSLPSPTPPVPAAVTAVPIVPAAAAPEQGTTTAPAPTAPSGGFDASSKWIVIYCRSIYFPFFLNFCNLVHVHAL